MCALTEPQMFMQALSRFEQRWYGKRGYYKETNGLGCQGAFYRLVRYQHFTSSPIQGRGHGVNIKGGGQICTLHCSFFLFHNMAEIRNEYKQIQMNKESTTIII